MHTDNSVEKLHNPLYSITILHTVMLLCKAVGPLWYLRQQKTKTDPEAQVSGYDKRPHAAALYYREQKSLLQCLI